MKHFGDITKLNGAELPIVDVITGGSPCQDLSVAGKRAGLDGERSGLFMEQIRLIKEMREHDRAIRGTDVDIRDLRPRYMVWENVPGAFSSNKGEDFLAVLQASLFDGIGGFPLVFKRNGATPVWASEIEEFPIAVTKIRFPEEEKETSGIEHDTREES